MIIDLHTHIWANLDQLGPAVAARWRQEAANGRSVPDAGPAAHERNMGCVDGAVVMGFRSERLEANVPSEFIAGFVARDPRRRVGVAGIDPMSPDAIGQLEAAVSLGLVGICVSPVCQGFHPGHSAAMRVYERCAELALPVFVTMLEPLTTQAELAFARPTAWDEVARDIPNLRIVIGQLGHPWIDETLLLLGKHENVFAVISGVVSRPWQLYNALMGASSFGVMDKLLFGSAFPSDTPARAIESLYTVNAYSHGTQLPSVPRSSLRAIVERDSLACLGIDTEIAPEPRPAEPEDADPPVVDVVPRPESSTAGRVDSGGDA